MSGFNNIHHVLDVPNLGPCILRNFGLDDLKEIVAIETRASQSPWSERNFRDSINSSHICIGIFTQDTDNKKCLAHAVFSLAVGEAELLILAVDPDWQGKKIASTLLTEMQIRLSASASQIFLEVRESNTSALALYESLNFHCIGERRNYYPPLPGAKGRRETALLYAKDLGQDEFQHEHNGT